MYRGPSYGGRSKATANTVCQKCLKRGHYSYECTVSAQERPYKPRPSRTQQLLNPNLKPKLSTEIPNELLRKKGIADEVLAKKEEQRGRKCSRDGSMAGRKRSRSLSSYSDDSVSTISTNRSPSRSRSPARKERNSKPSIRHGEARGKRGRSTSSDSHTSQRSAERNTRRRMSSFSPNQRGRRGRSSGSSRMDTSHDYDRNRPSRSRSHSRGRGRGKLRNRSRETPGKQNIISRSWSRSSGRMDTDDRVPSRNVAIKQENTSPQKLMSSTWPRSPLRNNRSPSPYSKKQRPRSPSPFRTQNGTRDRSAPYPSRGGRFDDGQTDRRARNGPSAPVPQRERSLSPYSKRVAMTRAMQGGQ